MELGLWLSAILVTILPMLLLLLINRILSTQTSKNSQNKFPKSYPIVGHLIALSQHKGSTFQWLSSLILSSSSSTFVLHLPFGGRNILTANPAMVEHVLSTRFQIYQKGPYQKAIFRDFLGDGLFIADGESWKFQRQIASHEFSTKSLRKLMDNVVDSQLYGRLISILSQAAKSGTILDLQDLLQRFGFDNICRITFGYDTEYLSPSLPPAKFAAAMEEAMTMTSMRVRTTFPILWKIRRFFNIGHEKRLKKAVHELQEFSICLVRQRKQAMQRASPENKEDDLLIRFMKSGHSDDKFLAAMVVNFILAGQDTISSALTWFFWLLHKNRRVEEEILREISEKIEHSSVFEQVKTMVYTHAALCESMRLYPPVPVEFKEAMADDTLPDGTPVKKGTRVTYHPYAMGRSMKLWGPDWGEYRPERWLEGNPSATGTKWTRFVPRDPYSYPVFQAGPRICLGKEMAFLQMKRVVAGILAKFKVVPALEEGFEPVYLPYMTAKMKGGFPVRFVERV